MNGFGEIDDSFWAKMAIFGPKWQKLDFFGKKQKIHFRTLIMLQHCAQIWNEPMNGF